LKIKTKAIIILDKVYQHHTCGEKICSSLDILSVERQLSIEGAIPNIESTNDMSDLLNLLKPSVTNIFE
jgi:hypothetical protein